jgi:hypothetical protein
MQNKLVLGLAALGVLAIAPACTSAPPPAARAAGVERLNQCAGTESGVAFLRSTRVLRIDPIYSHVASSKDGSENRVSGAKLLVQPPNGVSADQMDRILECHSAAVLLGQVSGLAVPNDPYWLPNSWVNIDVKPEGANFAVTLTADSLRDNLQVWGRASHYADEHQLAIEPSLQ